MIPVLFNKNEQQFRTYGLGEITDIINPKVTRERNGQYLLYFQYPQDAEFSDVFEEDMRIKSDAGVRTKWQTFEITRVIREEGKLIEVFAKHISQSLLKDALNPNVNVRSSNAQQALRTWNSNRIGDEEFDVWSDISTISSTSWNIQDVSNAFEALAGVQDSILDVWGGEYEFDNKMIRLHKEMGRKSPVPLEYGRNITGLEQDIQEDNVYTSIYPFATYIPESGSEPKTVTLPERYVDGKYLEMHNKRKIQVVDFSGEFESDDIPTVSRLKTLAKQYIESNEIGMPHENLKVGYLDLSKTLDYQKFKIMEEVELNDRLPIFYPKFGITNENAKVVVINYDPVKEENISIELGVIGQSFRTVTTGGVDSRLDKIEKQQKETVRYIVNNKGNRIWFETPDENMEHKIGDTWFEKNGLYDRIRVWNGNQWETIIDSEDIDKNAKAIAEQQQEIEEAKQTADEAVEQINTAVVNAGFTSLNETISSVQSISNQAQINSGAAINNALEAMQQASQAIDNSGSLNIRVDEVEGILSVKADKQTVDDLTGVVDTQALDIQTNAQGLALKANQSEVDTLTGTVSSLGTNFGIVAGQVNSRVWNTDIQTAVDGIEVGGRNLLVESRMSSGWADWFGGISGGDPYRVSEHIILDDGEYIYQMWNDSNDTSWWTATYYNESGGYVGGYIERYLPVGHTKELVTKDKYPSAHSVRITYNYRNGITHKLEKGNKATDWTPAPEDTEAKISHIETEWTQTFDTFNQTVAGIDGRVTQQKQTIDAISSTVSGHGGRISTVEQTASGLQSTVAGKASQTQVTQLANGLSSVVRNNDNLVSNPYFHGGDDTGWTGGFVSNADKDNPTREYYMNSDRRDIYNNVEFAVEGGETLHLSVNAWRAWVSSSTTEFGIGLRFFDERMTHITWVIGATKHSFESETIKGQLLVPSGARFAHVWIHQNAFSGFTDWFFTDVRVSRTPSYSEFNSQITQLANNINLRVTKGELLSQINIEAGRTLIQSDRLLLNATNTVITGTAWMDGAVIANASIDGAKIADATIGSAKIASLDVSKISGNTSEFVRTAWNNINDSIAIDGSGIAMLGNNIYRRNILNAEGISLYGDYGAYRKSGAIGYFRTDINTPDKNANVVDVGPNHEHYIGMAANKGYSLVLGFGASSWGDRFYRRSVIVSGDTGTVTMFGSLSMYNLDGIRWVGGGSNIHEKDSHLDIRSKGRLRLFNSINSLKAEFGAGLDMYGDINMHNNNIYNQSDSRLKTNITNHEDSSLSKITQVEFKDFVWEKNNQKGFGIIAQQVRLVAPELVSEGEDGYLGINSTRLNMMTVHAVKELAFKHDETNELAGQAYFLAETLADKMERLENRIEELERNVA